MKELLSNWQTTSTGLTLIIGSIVHLVFAVSAGTATEGVWTASPTGILGGVGLILAGDARKSATKAEVQTVSDAVVTGDTSHLANPDLPPRDNTTTVTGTKP